MSFGDLFHADRFVVEDLSSGRKAHAGCVTLENLGAQVGLETCHAPPDSRLIGR